MNFGQAISAGIKDISQAQLASMTENFDKFPGISGRSIVGGTDAQEIAVYDNGGSGWISAAINRKVIDISNIDFHIIEKGKRSRVEWPKVPEDIAMPFINGWAGMNFSKMAAMAVAREDLCGNDIWVKSTDANMYTQMTHKVGEFMLVPAGSWNIVMRPDYKAIWYYIISFGATVMRCEPQDVIHFRACNLINPFIGIGLISQHRAIVESEIVATEYENNFLVKDGSPSMVLTDKSVMNPDMAKVKNDQMQKAYASRKYRNGLFYAYGDVSVTAFKSSPKDVSYVKPMNRELIISIMQSSPIVLGLETSSGDRATAIRATNNYFDIVNSRANSICQTINSQFINSVDKSGKFELSFTPYPVGDIEELKLEVDTGLISRNEARRNMGRTIDENDPTMNQIYIDNRFIPIGQAYEGTSGQELTTAEVAKAKKWY